MARNWEDTLRSWVQRPSDNEDGKREATEGQIKDALKSSTALSDFRYRVYAKGSYANNTNVRLDYDVDIAVECRDFYVYDLSGEAATTKKAAIEAAFHGHTGPGATDFKQAVEAALVTGFGRSAVIPGKIAFRIRERKTTLPADVVPCVEYHRIYDIDANGVLEYLEGTKIFPRTGSPVVNWPQQQFEQGTAKNNATGHRYKRMVRALKRLQTELVKEKLLADELPSFLIECLVYNVPDAHFRHDKYVDDMRAVIAIIFQATAENAKCQDWLEVSRLKYLFRSSQPWTFAQAHALALAAWKHMGFH